MVEVVKGGEGLRCLSVRFTLFTEKAAFSVYAYAKTNRYKAKANAQDAHEAIRPSNVRWTPEDLKADLTAGGWVKCWLGVKSFSSRASPSWSSGRGDEIHRPHGGETGLRGGGEHPLEGGPAGLLRGLRQEPQAGGAGPGGRAHQGARRAAFLNMVCPQAGQSSFTGTSQVMKSHLSASTLLVVCSQQ